jgi:hypothetical protein
MADLVIAQPELDAHGSQVVLCLLKISSVQRHREMSAWISIRRCCGCFCFFALSEQRHASIARTQRDRVAPPAPRISIDSGHAEYLRVPLSKSINITRGERHMIQALNPKHLKTPILQVAIRHSTKSVYHSAYRVSTN